MVGSLTSNDPRGQLIARITARIAALSHGPFLRVAIDGVDGSGKTTFADELALALRNVGRPTVRASVDDFHNSRDVRYRRGRNSSEGFYLDSYDYMSLRRELLEPFGPSGSGRYRTKVFDLVMDMPIETEVKQAAPGSVLLLDGIFLHRPELANLWHMSMFLHVPFEISIPRGASRGPGYGSPDLNAASNRRYIEGQRRYLRECEPERLATICIDNSNLDAPCIIRSK
jgi:uridine kinase